MLQKSVGERLFLKNTRILLGKEVRVLKKFRFASLNIVIFHVKVPSHASKIQTPDIKGGDHSSIDYDSLLKLNIKIARWSQPDANIIIFTDYESFKDLPEDEKVTVIRLAVNGEEPMFERVLTMAAYVNSKLFEYPTIFLDIDAFLIRPVQSLFFEDFDVGCRTDTLLARWLSMKV